MLMIMTSIPAPFWEFYHKLPIIRTRSALAIYRPAVIPRVLGIEPPQVALRYNYSTEMHSVSNQHRSNRRFTD